MAGVRGRGVRERELVRLRRNQRARASPGSAGTAVAGARRYRAGPAAVAAAGVSQKRGGAAGCGAELSRFLTGPGRGTALEDLAYTLSFRRSHHDHRAAIVANGMEDFEQGLRSLAAGEASPLVSRAEGVARDDGRCVFVYTGMGPQWWGMGRQLLEHEPVFRQVVERCDAIFSTFAPWRLMDVFTCPSEQSRIASTEVAQPANFTLQAALTALWESWGITPAAVVGHSIGEMAAAYVSGALTLEEALRVSYHRSRLQQTQAGKGGMLAVGLPNRRFWKVARDWRLRYRWRR